MELEKTGAHGDAADRADGGGPGGGGPGAGPVEGAVAELQLPPGIPAAIPFERVQELVSALGLPLAQLRSFALYPYAIEAEFYAVDDEGRRYVRGHSGPVATHRVAIRVDR